MNGTLLIQVTNPKAIALLHELDELHLIKVLNENVGPAPLKLSDKYRGCFTPEQSKDLNEHIKQMRSEWVSRW